MNKLVIISVLFLGLNAFAKCEITYDRTACKGKEKDSYSKCDGNKVCTKATAAEDEEECKEEAMKACPNSRVQETKSKIITAKWSGKEILSKTGKKDFCADYEKKSTEFNQCE